MLTITQVLWDIWKVRRERKRKNGLPSVAHSPSAHKSHSFKSNLDFSCSARDPATWVTTVVFQVYISHMLKWRPVLGLRAQHCMSQKAASLFHPTPSPLFSLFSKKLFQSRWEETECGREKKREKILIWWVSYYTYNGLGWAWLKPRLEPKHLSMGCWHSNHSLSG